MRKQHCSFRFMFCKCKVAGRNLAATLWNASPIFDLVHRKMEALLKKELGTCLLKPAGHGGGGCISNGTGYMTDQGHLFVKVNSKNGARLMFDGEYASLAAIDATKTINVPKPIKVFDNPRGGAVCVMEYVDIHGLNKFSRELGEQLARLHLHNEEVGKQKEQQASSVHHDEGLEYVSQFGFHITTCCGFIPQDNTWNDSWVDFFSRQKLQAQLELVEEKYHDSEARELWSKLKLKIPSFFKDLDIKPALLHGDLWGGNAGETKSGPVIFDPASFYGHHEYELGIAGMFGGFGRSFYDAYHKLIPKAAGFEDRQSLYQLFHYLNHWNHFGSGYRSSSIGIMRQLIKV